MLEPGLVFLNHGSFGATPRAVLEAQHELVVQMERNPVAWLGRRAEALMADARSDLAAFVGASPDDLVFFPNPTTAMNMVARSLGLAAGDEVLVTDHEYGAMDRTWRKLCGEVGASVVRAALPLPVTTADDVVERVWRCVTPRTKVVFISHLTSATALVFPVAELCRRAREAGILAIVDGARKNAWLRKSAKLLRERAEVLVDHCRQSHAGLYYSDRYEFTEALKMLLKDGALRKTMGENGRAYVDANYRWDVIISKYERMFTRLRGGSGAAAGGSATAVAGAATAAGASTGATPFGRPSMTASTSSRVMRPPTPVPTI